MRDSLLFTFVFTIFQLFSHFTNGEYGCSIFCVCDIWFDLKRATCTNRRLYSIEIGISSVVEAIDLSNNSISSLSNYELTAAGLSKLRYLNLSGNGINEIDLAAFAKLNDLSVLDLSKNHLNYILTDTFVTNGKLKILKLQQNNFNLHVPKLRSSTITELDLSSCLISHLPVDAFDHLKKLSNVNLSKNIMIQLHAKVLQRLPSLRMISLEGNPWSCNRLMQQTQNYLQSRKVKFIPICELTKPKTFERMKLETPPPKKTLDIRLSSPKRPTEWDEPDDVKTLQALNISQNFNLSTKVFNTSPYWFIVIGFLLGSASTLLATYFITCKFFKSPRETDQRISLLQNDLSSICPGTPPPPYREVTLHRNLFDDN